jgi:hypothetical protein
MNHFFDAEDGWEGWLAGYRLGIFEQTSGLNIDANA